MYIAGDGLARGYHELPDLTGAAFMPNPFSRKPGARMYRTGDTARFLEDGKIEYIGRLDNQVKIRGYRIEPGEIETVLRQHRAVQAGVVLARKDEGGENKLIAYVVCDIGAEATVNDLRGFLKERLPAYMIPANIILLDAMPLTPNGKIDRQALAARGPAEVWQTEEKLAPRIPIEKAIADIWKKSLGIEQVSIEDSFFDIGGHSLLAMRVLSRLQETFEVDLQLRELFESPSVTELALAVVQRQAEQIAGEQLGLILADLERLPEAEAFALLAASIEADAQTGQLEAACQLKSSAART